MMRWLLLGLVIAMVGCAAVPKTPTFEMDIDGQKNALEQLHAAILEFRELQGRLPSSVQELQAGIKTVYSHAKYWEAFEIVAGKNKKIGTWELWAIEIDRMNPKYSLKLLNTDQDRPFYSE